MQRKTIVDDILGAIYDDGAERRLLAGLLEPFYARMLRSVHELMAAAFPALSFQLDDASTRRMLQRAATQVVRIDETTRNAIREVLMEGQSRGYSARQLAYGVRKDGFKGLDGLFKETWKSRPMTIARTEMQTAMLESAKNRYSASGVVEALEIFDGVDDDDACRARNGKIVPISTDVQLLHPRCSVTVSPVVRAGMLV